VARAARAERNERGARRGDAWRGKERPTTSTKIAAKGRGGRGARGGGGPSTAVRGFKLAVLAGAFLLIGFFVVLVVEGAASVISSVKIGGGSTLGATVSELVDKITTRVLDRDVPRTADGEPAVRRPSTPPRRAARPEPATQRAPVEASPRPEDDARHVSAPPPDPQTERARERLDDLLRRL